MKRRDYYQSRIRNATILTIAATTSAIISTRTINTITTNNFTLHILIFTATTIITAICLIGVALNIEQANQTAKGTDK